MNSPISPSEAQDQPAPSCPWLPRLRRPARPNTSGVPPRRHSPGGSRPHGDGLAAGPRGLGRKTCSGAGTTGNYWEFHGDFMDLGF
jgi:hypothetical protein